MLTTELLRTRQKGDVIEPRYVDIKKPKIREKAAHLIELYRQHVGKTRGELEEAIKDAIGDGTDFLVQRGLAKLLADRSVFSVSSAIPPVELRRTLFELSAKAHPVADSENVDLHHPITRQAVLEEAAKALSLTVEQVEASLYADLQDAYRIESFEDIEVEDLLRRYNLALAQGILFRAARMQIWLEKPDAKRLKQLIRYLKFFRLIASCEYEEEDILITVDGPLSLFRFSQKYGLQMATFLPALLLCSSWKLKADLLWEERRNQCVFYLDSDTELRSHYPDKGVYLTEEEEHLRQRWEALKTGDWSLLPSSRLLRMGSRDIAVSDYRLVHADGREAWLEIVGFWHREALEKRLALLREYGPAHLIVAVSTKMRVSEEDMADLSEQIYLYKDVMHPKRLIERAEAVARPLEKAAFLDDEESEAIS
jgi:predicted nuclease of restriction endonuclease-like RecB superfamily